jgi:hypothetical protein
MTVQGILTALIKGLTMYALSMAMAHGANINYNDWCDPSYCCPPKDDPNTP